MEMNRATRVSSMSIPDLKVKYNTSNMKPKTNGISLFPISSSN